MSKDRLEAFSDGVIAILITILESSSKPSVLRFSTFGKGL